MSCADALMEERAFPGGGARRVATGPFVAVLLAVVYPVLMIAYSFFGGLALQLTASLAGAVVFFVMLSMNTSVSGWKKMFMLVMMSSLFLAGGYGAFWTDMRSYGAILVLMSCLGVAWATLEYRIGRYVYEYPFFFFLVVTFFLIFRGTDQYEFNEVLAVGSRNVYSAILLALAVGYLVSRRISGKRTSVALGIALVVASFFLYSRTGLAFSFALFFWFLAGSGLAGRLKVLSILCLPALVLVPVFFDLGDFLARHSNFEKGLDSPRFAIWSSYFDDIDLLSFVIGHDMTSNALIAEFGGNPHSAYLRLHAYFGFGLFLLMLFPLLSVFGLLARREWFLVFLFFGFFLRAAFDPIYFIWGFDYIFYPFVFFVFFDGYFSSGVSSVFRSRDGVAVVLK